MARRFIHVLVTIYVASAVAYSSYSLLMTAAPKIQGWIAQPVQAASTARNGVKLPNSKHSSIFLDLHEETLHWPATPNEKNELRSSEVAMKESLFLSKAFSQSMQPCEIIPFYYKGSAKFEEDDITITTLVTFHRFKVFAELARRYRGARIVSWRY